jgi:hypothetical protein
VAVGHADGRDPAAPGAGVHGGRQICAGGRAGTGGRFARVGGVGDLGRGVGAQALRPQGKAGVSLPGRCGSGGAVVGVVRAKAAAAPPPSSDQTQRWRGEEIAQSAPARRVRVRPRPRELNELVGAARQAKAPARRRLALCPC